MHHIATMKHVDYLTWVFLRKIFHDNIIERVLLHTYFNCLCGSSAPRCQDGIVPRPNKPVYFHNPLVSTAKIHNFLNGIIYYFFFFTYSLQDFLTEKENISQKLKSAFQLNVCHRYVYARISTNYLNKYTLNQNFNLFIYILRFY
jgi:hypothetical protein